MRLVVQRVTRARVSSAGERLGDIGSGAVVLAGIAQGDTEETVVKAAAKLLSLRYFRDAEGRTNLDIGSVGGAYLVVSQFTLLADVRRGRRPGFTGAAEPETAERLVRVFTDALSAAGVHVESGRFAAEMELELVNDGPFTLVVDSDDTSRR